MLDAEGLEDVDIVLPNRNVFCKGQFDIDSHSIVFLGGIWNVTKGAMVLAHGQKIRVLHMRSKLSDMIAMIEANSIV